MHFTVHHTIYILHNQYQKPAQLVTVWHFVKNRPKHIQSNYTQLTLIDLVRKAYTEVEIACTPMCAFHMLSSSKGFFGELER